MKYKFYAIKLSVVIIAVFLLQVLVSGFTEMFVLSENSFIQPWRFVGAVFLHGGLGHLVLNLFALLFFGSVLERFIGGRRFLYVFFVTGILANLVSVNFYSTSLGASGAIFGIIMSFGFCKTYDDCLGFWDADADVFGRSLLGYSGFARYVRLLHR